MKAVLSTLAVLVLCFASGCATGPKIGVLSSMAVDSNIKAAQRKAIMHTEIPVENKVKAMELTALGASYSDVKAAAGADVPIEESQLEFGFGEKASVFAAQMCDLGIYAGLAFGVKKLYDDWQNPSQDSQQKQEPTVSNKRSGNGDVTVSSGDGSPVTIIYTGGDSAPAAP